jgi:uncharacterized surface protein with fasciclin (FAS1) repeats
MNQSNNALVSHAASDRDTAPTKDLVATASSTGSFTSFAAGIAAAGLTDALSAKGPFTVFAPTDEAFRRLPAGAWARLLRDSAKLKAILNYHIVAGYLIARDVKSGEVMTLQGSTLTMAISHAEVRVNGARVVQADLAATNGVLHSIDAVILPKNWRLAASAVSGAAATR